MKINQATRITGTKVILVPYHKDHVPKYHEWMQSAELRLQTASEALSLDEEFEMQKSWAVDEDKCTFIVLSQQLYEESDHDQVKSMVGDVNLFFTDTDDRYTTEIEIMIAETGFRGQGLGREALLAMMSYGISCLGIRNFQAKIGYKNTTSQLLFQKLGFVEVSRSDVFEEMTLVLFVTSNVEFKIKQSTLNLVIADEANK